MKACNGEVLNHSSNKLCMITGHRCCFRKADLGKLHKGCPFWQNVQIGLCHICYISLAKFDTDKSWGREREKTLVKCAYNKTAIIPSEQHKNKKKKQHFHPPATKNSHAHNREGNKNESTLMVMFGDDAIIEQHCLLADLMWLPFVSQRERKKTYERGCIEITIAMSPLRKKEP